MYRHFFAKTCQREYQIVRVPSGAGTRCERTGERGQRKRTPLARSHQGALYRIWARRDSNPRPHPGGVNRFTPPLDPPPTWYPPTPNREHAPRHLNHPYHVRSPTPKHPAHRAHNPRYSPCEHTPLSSLPIRLHLCPYRRHPLRVGLSIPMPDRLPICHTDRHQFHRSCRIRLLVQQAQVPALVSL